MSVDVDTNEHDLFAAVVGQEKAVAALRRAAQAPVHAYLFVGAPGTGKRAAAQAFAAMLLCPDGGCGACDTCRRVQAGVHLDYRVFEREGAFLSMTQVPKIVKLASQVPVEARRKVVVIPDLHLVTDVGPALLKTIEEPSSSTVIIGLADTVPPELVTIASRCLRVDFRPLAPGEVVAALVASGIPEAKARDVVAAAAGRLDRARLLAADPAFAARLELWRSVPAELDGSGAAVAAVTDRLVGSMEEILVPLREAHERELTQLEDHAKQMGERLSGRKEITDRHNRELRRVRTDELMSGLATLASAYRERLVTSAQPAGAMRALEAISSANAAIRSNRNPNETLLLHDLLLKLTLAG